MTRARALLRPTLPAALWLAGALWIGLILGEGATAIWKAVWIPWATGGVAAALGCTVLVLSGWARTVGAVTAVVLAGAWLGALTWCGVDAANVALLAEGRSVLEGRVASDPVSGPYGCTFELSGAVNGGVVRVFAESEPGLELGRDVVVQGTVVPPDEAWARTDRRRGVIGAISATSVSDRDWAQGIHGLAGRARARAGREIANVQGEGGTLLRGMLLGDRRGIRDTQLEFDAQAAGLAHMLAVSGTHLAVVAAFSAAACGLMRLPRSFSVGLVLVACAAYVVVSGSQPSALRALGLVGATQMAPTFGRRGDSLSALALVIALILAVDPTAAFSLALMMSAAAVLGILLLGPLARGWCEAALPRALRGLAGPVAVCMTAQAATLPLTAGTFAQFPLAGTVSNLVAIPLVSLGLASGLLGLLFTPLGVGRAVLKVAGFILAQVAAVAHACAALPGASVPLELGPWVSVGLVSGLAGLWVVWPRPRRVALAPIVLIAALAGAVVIVGQGSHAGPAELIVMDVGQGDAIALKSEGRVLLVDTGEDPVELRRALARNGIRHADRVLLTHAHADHTGGLEGLTGMMPRDAVRVSAAADPAGLGSVQPRYDGGGLVRGDSLHVGDLHVRVVWPPEDLEPDEENEASLVMHVTSGSFSALLTGDAEEPVYSELAESGLLPASIDVLKVPHHGSADGVRAENLKHLAPEVALISVGTNNEFGHPSRSTLGELRSCGARIFRTDEHGDLVVILEAGGWSVATSRWGTAAYETMPPERVPAVLCAKGVLSRVIGPDRSQAGVPDTRQGGSPAGAGGRSLEEPLCSGRRSRLQPQDLRWGVGRRLRDRCVGEHASVHVRAPPCCRSQG